MIAVVGAGITGLVAAWSLRRAGKVVHLFEASGRVGGNIQSVTEQGCLLELGPNSLRMDDALYSFLTIAGLTDEIQYAAPAAKNRYVLADGGYRRLPGGPLSFLFGGFFPWREKLRVLRERKVGSRSQPGESVDAFFRRRFGDFVADQLLGPFVSGIYAGDARELLAAEAFPQLVAYETSHGSVIKGMLGGGPRNRHKGVFNFKHGLSTLPDKLADDLGLHVHLHTALSGLSPTEEGWELNFGGQKVQAEQVVLALPAAALARILQATAPALAARLARVHYPPVAVVHRVYQRGDISHPLDGFGALNVPGGPGATLGTIFSSSVFPGRVPPSTVLLTTMVGGATQPETIALGEAAIRKAVDEDHQRWLGARRPPQVERITTYPSAIPQYDAQVVGLSAEAAAWQSKGLWLAGNWTGGISVPNCIQQGIRICEQLRNA
jgi:oxygen-dependent protoporphyrinogen oxidase